jgi:hypothetical protein
VHSVFPDRGQVFCDIFRHRRISHEAGIGPLFGAVELDGLSEYTKIVGRRRRLVLSRAIRIPGIPKSARIPIVVTTTINSTSVNPLDLCAIMVEGSLFML